MLQAKSYLVLLLISSLSVNESLLLISLHAQAFSFFLGSVVRELVVRDLPLLELFYTVGADVAQLPSLVY